MWRTGLVAPWHVGSSQTGARTHVACTGRRIRNHCATREAPLDAFDFGTQWWTIICVIVIITVIFHFNSDANFHHPLHLLQVGSSKDGNCTPHLLTMGYHCFQLSALYFLVLGDDTSLLPFLYLNNSEVFIHEAISPS